MNPTAIYSKSGKGVQEASGKTSLLKRPDRAVLSAIDGRATLADVAQKVGRTFDASFQSLIQQLDKDGFVREVSAGAPSAAPAPAPASRPGVAAPKPAAKPAAKPADPASDLDFSSIGGSSKPAAPASRPAAPPPPPPKPSAQQVQQAKAQQSALDKAREEAEAKAAAERDRVKREAEDKAKSEIEAKMRADAEKKMKEEAEARVKAEAEAKVKAARDAAARAAAEARAKAEAEAQAKVEAERKAREEMERRLEAERKAREEAERRAREEAERRAREEAERKAREEAERKAREEAERLRREAEEHARKVREEAERKAKEEADRVRRELEAERKRLEEDRRKEEEERAARRKQREEEERREDEERAARRRQREEEDAREREESASRAAPPPAAPPPEAPKAAAKGGNFADSLMADLDSFTNKDEEDQKAREEAERNAKAERRRRDEEAQRLEAERAERQAAESRRREEDEARRREEDEARRRDEEKRRAREEEERIAREEERRKREAEEIQRKAEAATVAARAKQASGGEEDIPIDEDDLDMSEVKQERKALGIDEKKEREKAKEAEREAKRKKRADEKRKREVEKQAERTSTPAASARSRRSSSWGRPVALLLAVVLVIAVGAAHLMPIDVAPYEQAASDAVGRPVKIGSARLWLFTGVQLRFDGVRVGDTRIGRVVAHPAIGSLWGEQKRFSEIDLEGVTLPQAAVGDALFSRLKGERFAVERIMARDLELTGGLALPKLDADLELDPAGALRAVSLHGPDALNARIEPKGDGLTFEATAAGLPLPIGPEVTLSQFAMKGTATRQGIDITEWGGALFNGGISGTARLRWGSTWDVEGVVTVRNINAAVFAPALLSQGNAEGTGRFTMSGPDPAKLLGASRVEGRFTVSQGTLGSFDLSRAIQSRGKEAIGTTQFAELTGQGTYDHGSVTLRNVTIGAGALNAGASADISKSGALSGRIVADVKNAGRTLSATLNLGGTVKEPQVRD